MTTRYYRQRKDYTCGPVSLQMALSGFGITAKRSELINACRTTPETGTSRKNLIRAAQSWGLEVAGTPDWTISRLRKGIASGAAVIVNFREPKDEMGHYGLVKEITSTEVVLDDPWLGPGFRMPIKEFVRRWYGYHRTICIRWAMTIRAK